MANIFEKVLPQLKVPHLVRVAVGAAIGAVATALGMSPEIAHALAQALFGG